MNPSFPADECAPFFFPAWTGTLAAAPCGARQREDFRREIVRFLGHCRKLHAPATVALAKAYVESHPASAMARPALRWFFSRGAHIGNAAAPTHDAARHEPRRSSFRARDPIPPCARHDLGRTDWERALIAAARERGFLWRTERTYRDWAVRFARFIAPRLPWTAEAAEVGAFLSSLAVEHRASQSTQKQALNALVFFLQEGLKRQLPEIAFQRAEAGRKVPTVLSRNEVARLLAHLNGTTRLMAA